MSEDELECMFSDINGVEDMIAEIENPNLYEYVVNCIQNNEYCTTEGYEEFIEENNND